MLKINGGYPPLIRCNTAEAIKNPKNDLKKRFFAPKQEINIRKILKQRKKNLIVDENDTDSEELNIISDF